MSDSRLQKLEDRVLFLRQEAEAFKRQSYQQADLLSDVVPALARLGHASTPETLDAALALARSVTDNSQNVDVIREQADAFLGVYKAARDAGVLQSPESVWRDDLANVLDGLSAETPAVVAVIARLRDNTPLDDAFKPLISALRVSLETQYVDVGVCCQLADAVLTLPLTDADCAAVGAVVSELRVQPTDQEILQHHYASLTELLVRGLSAARERDQQMQHLFIQMRSELEVVDRFLGALNTRDDNALAGAVGLERAVAKHSSDALSIFDQSDSVTDIRQHVASRTQDIRQSMATFVASAQAERDRAALETRVLSGQLKALESELEDTRAALVKAQDRATRDYLTGLYNRRAFEDDMVHRLARVASPADLGCVIWDIDHFKQVNDSHGHNVGDRVLQTVAAVLAEHCRESDIVARLGGEEFVTAVHGLEVVDLLAWANGVREQVALTLCDHGPAPIKVSVSCGVAVFQRGDSLVSMLARADRALYDAKAQGRNCCALAA